MRFDVMTSEPFRTYTHTHIIDSKTKTHTYVKKCLEAAAAVSLLLLPRLVINHRASAEEEENKKKSSSRERLNFWKSWKLGRKGPG